MVSTFSGGVAGSVGSEIKNVMVLLTVKHAHIGSNGAWDIHYKHKIQFTYHLQMSGW